MKINKYQLEVIICMVIGIFVACDSGNNVKELIKGQWIVNDVVRRGKNTNTLNGLSFEFRKDSVLTNLSLLGNNLYKIDTDSITISSNPPLRFHIKHLDTSNLILSGKIQNTPFLLTFNRVEP
ncbi:hypothetical protein [Membranihabitans maritimus]|uniref:hypothetical protein n=1 Tax=Membranihabitans maritimus TaxID=2904244 RepID=UPI001F3120D3|nr:hypothetical protein [Membranihabitans maritimus]